MINQTIQQSKFKSGVKVFLSSALWIAGIIVILGFSYNILTAQRSPDESIPEMIKAFKFTGDIVDFLGWFSWIFLLAPVLFGLIFKLKSKEKNNSVKGGIIISKIGTFVYIIFILLVLSVGAILFWLASAYR